MMRAWIIFSWLLFSGLAVAGPLEEGVTLWESGDMDGAVEIWHPAQEERQVSGILHYNLGIAMYRKGDLASAIAHWRQGRLLRPRDANLVHNLAVARSELKDVPEPMNTQPNLLQIATPAEWAGAGVLLLSLASLLLWLPVSRKRLGPWPAMAMGFVGVLFWLVSAYGSDRCQNAPGLVVVGDAAYLRTLATRDSEVVGMVPPGTELAVERIAGTFLLVRQSNGDRGWVPESAGKIIGETVN
jgi:hypothetical protein